MSMCIILSWAGVTYITKNAFVPVHWCSPELIFYLFFMAQNPKPFCTDYDLKLTPSCINEINPMQPLLQYTI